MRGDFSRLRFNRRKNYTAVLQQQGRVELDADSNEQRFIDEFLRRSETVDVIGEFGGPVNDTGFQITVVNNNEMLIGPGRYYVDGLMCENLASLSYEQQPYLVDPVPFTTLLGELEKQKEQSVCLQVYLEVWERLVTALDDPCLREPALGRADTTDRIQTVWRVVAGLVPTREFEPVAGSPLTPCCQSMYQRKSPVSTGTMCAQTSPPSDDCGCEPVPAAWYQGIENQLYRIEIQSPGDLSAATFKWSRENGSVVAAVTAISGSTLTLSTLGPDANLGFQAGQWVELTDDSYQFGELPNRPGTLYQIQSIQPADLSVTLVGAVTPVDTTKNARLRRWDQTGPSASSTGIPLSSGWIQLENGIEVSFTDGTYQWGDFWTIPARTATGQIDWPPCGSEGSQCQPPKSVIVHLAPLACIHLEVSKAVRRGFRLQVDDCRRLFSPLTALSPATAAQAIHVDEVSWANDDIMTFDQLIANGLTITLDQAPVSPVNGANFIVTLESIVLPPRLERIEPGQPLPTVMRAIAALDSEITVDETALSWLLPDNQDEKYQLPLLQYLEEVLLIGAAESEFARVRVRLPGEVIYATSLAGGMLYLDGKSFGQNALRQDGSTPRIDLQLPSGSDATASDFNGWFYLAPALSLTFLTVEYPNLTAIVDSTGQFVGVQVTGTPGQVNPTATITVNYPAAVQATVTLALSGASGAGSVAGIPASQTIDVGQTSASFPIYILASPPYNQTLDFTITATLAFAGNLPASVMTAGFTVTGPPDPVTQ
jgi:Family of unknown function (DUF6519)